MKANKILDRLASNERAYGCALTFPSTTLVELIGIAGMDFLYIDGEHGSFSRADIEDMCRVAEMFDVTPVARAPNILPSTVLSYLDRGVMGIEGPHVTTEEDARQFAAACYYAPKGSRSLGASRGARFGTSASATEYTQEFNSQVYVFALLEDIDVLDNIDGILSVEGIHTYHVGNNDLAQSMGLPGQPNHPDVLEVAQRITDKVHAAGKKLSEEVVVAARGTNLFLDGARSFMASEGQG